MTPRRRRAGQSGAVMIEMALTSTFIVGMLILTMTICSDVIRMIQTNLFTRDIGHMWARGVDFKDPANQNLALKVGRGLDFRLGTGNGVAILSQIEYLSQTECKNGCTNINQWVLVQRLNMGNTSLPKSKYLANPPANELDANGYVTKTCNSNYCYFSDPQLAMPTFNLLRLPLSGGQPTNEGFNSGTPVYMIETYFMTPSWSGLRDNPYIYTVSLF